jgi:hypothetical protein
MEASIDDMPAIFSHLVVAIHDFKQVIAVEEAAR